jgi:threonine/homoserine/homoserine lactone efflux protein
VGEAIGQVLVLAVGVAVSPLPIIAVVLLLVTPRARSNGPAFVLGCLLGLAAVGAIVLLLAPDASDEGEPATWVGIAKLVLGAALLLLALQQWRGRPRQGEEAPAPGWMSTMDDFTAPKALGAGVVLSGANPKNLVLAVAAAASIAQTGIPGSEQAIAYGVFSLLGCVGVAVPVAVYFALGERAGPVLHRLKAWMARHSAVIMALVLILIGVKLAGDALTILA